MSELFNEISENASRYWTGVTAALSEAAVWLKDASLASATKYEALGHQLTDLAANYARGLMDIGNGLGSAQERAMLMDMGSKIIDNVEQMRQSGSKAFTKAGESAAAAAYSASVGRAAGIGGALVDAVNLTHAVQDAIESGNWDKVGAVSASIGAAAAFGATAAEGVAAGAVILGIVGAPAIITVFVVAGLAAILGDALGVTIFKGLKGIADSVNNSYLGARGWTPPRDPLVLVLDLDGDGIETVGIGGNPVLFDHSGNGVKTGTGWVKPDDGFLVLDRNGNGLIDSGRELFGVD
ncbi:MAG: hypothetical protein FWD68_21680, partial [Alphaproteobacteria bacterium]|nr:hypothetical protein [Alphaproteobacteria bacterium]